MEPHRRYTQKVKKAFHISMAALDLSTSSTEPAQVMCGFEGRNYLLCTLKKPDVLQCPLNLNFDVSRSLPFLIIENLTKAAASYRLAVKCLSPPTDGATYT